MFGGFWQRIHMGIRTYTLVIFSLFFMKTKDYNPSPLEVKFVEALKVLKPQISKKLGNFEIIDVHTNTKLDNPIAEFHLKDTDGDPHSLVVRVIQKPD